MLAEFLSADNVVSHLEQQLSREFMSSVTSANLEKNEFVSKIRVFWCIQETALMFHGGQLQGYQRQMIRIEGSQGHRLK